MYRITCTTVLKVLSRSAIKYDNNQCNNNILNFALWFHIGSPVRYKTTLPRAEGSALCFARVWTSIGLSSWGTPPCGYKTPRTNSCRVHSAMRTALKRALCFAFEIAYHGTCAWDHVSSIRQVTAVWRALNSTTCSAYCQTWRFDQLFVVGYSLFFNVRFSISFDVLHSG